ncbi:MAG: amidohydrolase [Candidatus Micrarchaeota archaeon]|nr:amidohydrolase [Candidatus Micrarchaeota archaeon]MDE1834170.1 amidohydrolase [Candidatus Micrarchaeota archaeon]MDE1858979.1 amidohydrolase [Candidatus Micrarchaeota archaeon]
MMIFDIHAHIGDDKDGGRQSAKELLAHMDHNGVDMAAVFPFDEKEKNLIEASLSLLNLNEKRFACFLRFDPNTTAPDTVSKHISRFKGVKLHPRSQNFDPIDKRYYPLYEEISKSGKPLLIHTKKGGRAPVFTDPDRIASLADDFTDINIILGHFADRSPAAVQKVKECENLYLETSIDSFHPNGINKIYDIVGADKILFGSDAPYGDQELELLKVMKTKLTYEEKSAVLYENAAKLLKL